MGLVSTHDQDGLHLLSLMQVIIVSYSIGESLTSLSYVNVYCEVKRKVQGIWALVRPSIFDRK